MGFAYKITDQQGIHFIKAPVVQWIDVFTRKDYTEEYIYSSVRDFYNRKGLLALTIF